MKTRSNTLSTGIAELKSKLASFLRRTKAGEEIEILERGIPIARLTPIQIKSSLTITPPRKAPELLGKYRFSVRPRKSFDILELLLEDRIKR